MGILRILGIVGAVFLHVGFILFGGLLFIGAEDDLGTLQVVDLLTQTEAEKEQEKPEPEPDKDLETQDEEPPPDASDIVRSLEAPPAIDAPALDAASLGSIEAALSGAAGGGDFATGTSFASGGRIGGRGKPGSLDESLENAFSLAEIDQKPRALYQSSPTYPSSMRARKAEGVVTVLFIVDPAGKVTNPRVEKSSNAAFEKPALDAVKQWKFEPAIKGGQRVACRMRVPIRFQPS